MMPDVWTVFYCGSCRAAMARGGLWAFMDCPSCQHPMVRTEHRPAGP